MSLCGSHRVAGSTRRRRACPPPVVIPLALGWPTVRDVPLALAGDIAVLLLAQHAPARFGNPDRRVRAPGRGLVALPVDGGGFAADGLVAQVVAGLGAETVDTGRVVGEGIAGHRQVRALAPRLHIRLADQAARGLVGTGGGTGQERGSDYQGGGFHGADPLVP